MNFWKFCEKVSCCVGFSTTIRYIKEIKDLYERNFTVGQVRDRIKKLCDENSDEQTY